MTSASTSSRYLLCLLMLASAACGTSDKGGMGTNPSQDPDASFDPSADSPGTFNPGNVVRNTGDQQGTPGENTPAANTNFYSTRSGKIAVDCSKLDPATPLTGFRGYESLRALCKCYVDAGPGSSIQCNGESKSLNQVYPVEDCAAEFGLRLKSGCQAKVSDLLACAAAEKSKSDLLCNQQSPPECAPITACLNTPSANGGSPQ